MTRPTGALAWALPWIVATAGGVWMATWRLSVASTVNDEIPYRAAAAAMLAGNWTLNNQHPPLAKELIAVADVLGRHAGASPLVSDRLVGAAAFVVTGLLLGWTGTRLGGRTAGLVAALLWWGLPLSPGVLVAHVDRYALLEGPMLAAVAAVTAVAVGLVDAEGHGGGDGRGHGPAHGPARGPGHGAGRRWAGWVLLGVCLGAATACKLLGVLVAPVALVPALVAARVAARTTAPGPAAVLAALARLGVAGATSLLVFAATYLPMGAHAWPAVRTAVTFQLQHADAGHLQTVAGHNYLFPPVWAPWWFQEQYLHPATTLALWGAAVAGIVTAVATGRLQWRRSPGCAGWVPLVGLAVGVSAVASMSIKLPQYHDVLVPFLDVLAAWGLVGLARLTAALAARGTARVMATSLVGLLAGLLVAGLGVPLAVRVGQQVTSVARLRPGDYRVAAQVLRAHGVVGPVVVWGDAAALAAQGYPVTTTPVMPADCRPVALVTDATSVHRLPVDVPAWRRSCGAAYERVRIDRVTVYVRPAA